MAMEHLLVHFVLQEKFRILNLLQLIIVMVRLIFVIQNICYIYIRPEREFWPEPEPDCYNLAGTGTGSTSYKSDLLWPDS